MKIVFVRHAHRHKLNTEEDNGLSDKGRTQVDDLEKSYEKGTLPASKHFWTSPKLRCMETLKPLSDSALAPLRVEKMLDEQSPAENQITFRSRIHDLIEKAIALNDTVYLCSHGDLLPEAIDQLTGKSMDISKGQAVVVQNIKGRWTLL